MPGKRHSQSPIEGDAAAFGKPEKIAGGATAVRKALRFALGEAGLVRGISALYRLNQFGGVDCPGCAWPDPDDHRSRNEYCETGATAIAEEATSLRISSGFFKQWSLSRLSQQSDYWLGHQGRLTEPMVLRPGQENYEPVSWQDAFGQVARELNAL